MRMLGLVVGTPFAIMMTAFAVSNRGLIRLDLWPLQFGVEMPIYLMVLGPLMVGFLFGVIVMRLAVAGRLRACTREMRILEQKVLKRQFPNTAPNHAQA